jgi:hypothetical protein
VTLPEDLRYLPPPLGWDYLALPPGGPFAITAIDTGIDSLTHPVIPWWIVFNVTLDTLEPTQDLILQITQPDGIRYQVIAAQARPPSAPTTIVAGAAVPQLPTLNASYTQINLPLRAWTPPVGVRITTSNLGILTGAIVPFSTWLVYPQAC